MTISYAYPFAVGASVIDAVAVLDTPSQYREMYSVTVTCTIHPESEAELCEAVLIASGNLTRISTLHYTMYMCTYLDVHILIYIYIYC